MPSTYIQPSNFSDYLANQIGYCLFLDIDGTLADFTIDPKASFIPKTTLTLLQDIQRQGVPIAVVTGRSLAKARQMLSPLQVPIAATHGLEISLEAENYLNEANAGNVQVTSGLPINMAELNEIKQVMIQSCQPYTDIVIEQKPYSCALHYRQNPALADVAYRLMSNLIEDYPNWTLKQGKYVWEIIPKGVNKGAAILSLLSILATKSTMPTKSTKPLCPIFIGDDITDEAGFEAVQQYAWLKTSANNVNNTPLHDIPKTGIGIKVGSEPTAARYYVNNIAEVIPLLEYFLSMSQKTYPN